MTRLLPLLVAFLIAGCSATALGDLASMAGVGGSGNGPEGPVAPPQLASSPSECHQGTWRLVPETAWSSENLARMGLGGGADYEYVGSEGDAWLTLQPDGTYAWSLNRFAVTLRGNASSSSPTDVTVNMHGMMYGTAVSGSEARTLDMHYGASSVPETRLTAFATVAGGGMGALGQINLNAERIIGESRWTSSVQCNGNELAITTQNESSGALQNATYTKAR